MPDISMWIFGYFKQESILELIFAKAPWIDSRENDDDANSRRIGEWSTSAEHVVV